MSLIRSCYEDYSSHSLESALFRIFRTQLLSLKLTQTCVIYLKCIRCQKCSIGGEVAIENHTHVVFDFLDSTA